MLKFISTEPQLFNQRGLRAFDLIASSLFENVFKQGPLVQQQQHFRHRTHAKQRVGLKRHLCGSSWPRRRPQPDLKFVTQKKDTFQLVLLKNCEKTFYLSWFLAMLENLASMIWIEFVRTDSPQIYPKKSHTPSKCWKKSSSTILILSQPFCPGLVLTNVELRGSL